ncbi:MAG: hypothetical protein R3Y13_01765 [bacterium]
MEVEMQVKIRENEKYYNYLKENSEYVKYLNRASIDYKKFIDDMKIKYKERASDKVSNFIDNIDLVSTIMDTFR